MQSTCSYAVGTTSFLTPTDKYTKITARRFYEEDLIYIAKLLDIDPTLPNNIICQQVQKNLPTRDWFIANFTGSRQFSPEVKS